MNDVNITADVLIPEDFRESLNLRSYDPGVYQMTFKRGSDAHGMEIGLGKLMGKHVRLAKKSNMWGIIKVFNVDE